MSLRLTTIRQALLTGKPFAQNVSGVLYSNPKYFPQSNYLWYQIYPRAFHNHSTTEANEELMQKHPSNEISGLYGTFKGIAHKVEYIASLGVTGIWLNPINLTNLSNQNDTHGYAIRDYYELAPDLGTEAEFETMISALHNNGIKVVMDLVVNHSSQQNKWFRGETPDYYRLFNESDFPAGYNKAANGWHNKRFNLYFAEPAPPSGVQFATTHSTKRIHVYSNSANPLLANNLHLHWWGGNVSSPQWGTTTAGTQLAKVTDNYYTFDFDGSNGRPNVFPDGWLYSSPAGIIVRTSDGAVKLTGNLDIILQGCTNGTDNVFVEIVDQWYLGVFSEFQPDFDYTKRNEPPEAFSNPVVAEMVNVGKYWMDKGIDGFRFDAPTFMFDRIHQNAANFGDSDVNSALFFTPSDDRTYEVCSEINRALQDYAVNVLGHDGYFSLSEVFTDHINTTIENRNRYASPGTSFVAINDHYGAGGHFTSSFDFNVWSAFEVQGKIDPHGIKSAYESWNPYRGSIPLSNHDVPRLARRYSPNGDPTADVKARIRLATAIQLTLPNNPFVYNGDEFYQTEKREATKWTMASDSSNNMILWIQRIANIQRTHDAFNKNIQFLTAPIQTNGDYNTPLFVYLVYNANITSGVLCVFNVSNTVINKGTTTALDDGIVGEMTYKCQLTQQVATLSGSQLVSDADIEAYGVRLYYNDY